MVDIVVLVAGLGILAALATVIGRSSDQRSRDTAWRRIADARHENWQRGQDLDQRQDALERWADDLTARERRSGRAEPLLP